MPFKTEHAARQADPRDFDRFRRTHPEGWPTGLDAIWGIRADGSTAIQSVRADAERWTPAKLREWLVGAGMKADIEEAVEASDSPSDLLLSAFRAAREKAGDASTPAEPSERRRGSSRNPAGSASDPGGIDFSEQTEGSIRSMVADFNEGREAGRRISTATARAVVRRGFGAFSTSHRPGMSRVQWGLARLRSFLELAGSGAPDNPKYIQDNDLLPDWHRRSTKKAEGEPDLSLPAYMIAALRRGLKAHKEGRTGDGLQPATVRLARQGVETGRWPADKWVKARAWFRRHRSDWTRGRDTKPGDESPGFAAWLLWADGGDGRGRARVERIAEQIAGPVEKAASPVLAPPPEPNREQWPYQATIDADPSGALYHSPPRILVETPAGHVRSGVDLDGESWSVIMPAHYGEFEGTRGADGDPIDVFVGPDLDAEMVYVFAIAHPDGSYDEDKVFFGFPTLREAEIAFGAAYRRDDLIFGIRAVDRWDFAWWLAEHGRMGHAFHQPIERLGSRTLGVVIKSSQSVPLAPDPAHAVIKFLTQIAQGVEMATGQRLTEIDVKEVSPVDRAANGKTFAVVKSADGAGPAVAEAEKSEGDAVGPADVAKADGADVPVEKVDADVTPPAPVAPVEKGADDAPADIETAKAEGPTTPPTIPVEPKPASKPVSKMEHGDDERMMKAAAGLLNYAGGDMRKAIGALAGVDDEMMKAAAESMKMEADPMAMVAHHLGRIADSMGMSKGAPVEKAAPPSAEPVDIDAAIQKAIGDRIDALAGRVASIEGQTARPNGSTGGESVTKSDKPGGWPSRLA